MLCSQTVKIEQDNLQASYFLLGRLDIWEQQNIKENVLVVGLGGSRVRASSKRAIGLEKRVKRT